MRLFALALGLTLLAHGASGSEPAKDPPANRQPADPEQALDLEALYEQGQALFNELAPPEVKRQVKFPTKQQWFDFAQRFQRALENNDLQALAAYAPEARAALSGLRLFPELADYADWLEERLDYVDAADQVVRRVPVPRPPPTAPKPRVAVPHYDLWLARIQARPTPPRAAALLPQLRAVFAAEGLPPDLVWLAEAESTFNPQAVSPVGAKGLFQLMPATAKELGLSTFLPDERTDPAKNARAAARYLKKLHGQFGDWPLALAAYNAGPGRVRRMLEAKKAKTFADIAPALSAETRMYVPKVLAILATRAGVAPGALPPPR